MNGNIVLVKFNNRNSVGDKIDINNTEVVDCRNMIKSEFNEIFSKNVSKDKNYLYITPDKNIKTWYYNMDIRSDIGIQLYQHASGSSISVLFSKIDLLNTAHYIPCVVEILSNKGFI